MLGKLIGFEMRAFGRIMLPLYAAVVGVALLIGLGIRFLPEKMYSNMLGATVIMIFVFLIIASIVMTGVLCVQRFYQNLLGTEGYLMFSLPVETHELILSKVLGSYIWTVLGGVTAFLTMLAMGLGAMPMNKSLSFFRRLRLHIDMQTIGGSIGSFLLWAVIAALLFSATLMQIYAALAVGHQWTAHRILGSVLAYFGFDFLKSTVFWILTSIGVRIGLLGFLISQAEETAGSIPAQATVAVSAAASIAVYSLITWYFLDKRLNLE